MGALHHSESREISSRASTPPSNTRNLDSTTSSFVRLLRSGVVRRRLRAITHQTNAITTMVATTENGDNPNTNDMMLLAIEVLIGFYVSLIDRYYDDGTSTATASSTTTITTITSSCSSSILCRDHGCVRRRVRGGRAGRASERMSE